MLTTENKPKSKKVLAAIAAGRYTGRPTNKQSVRQRALKRLNQLKHTERKKAIEILKEEFDIGDRYAATLHATHRTLLKETGKMKKLYVVKDTRNGKEVNPYMSSVSVHTLKKYDASTPDTARSNYIQKLEKKKLIAIKLK